MFPGVLPSALSLGDLIPSHGLSSHLYVVDTQSNCASEHRHIPQHTGHLQWVHIVHFLSYTMIDLLTTLLTSSGQAEPSKRITEPTETDSGGRAPGDLSEGTSVTADKAGPQAGLPTRTSGRAHWFLRKGLSTLRLQAPPLKLSTSGIKRCGRPEGRPRGTLGPLCRPLPAFSPGTWQTFISLQFQQQMFFERKIYTRPLLGFSFQGIFFQEFPQVS